MLFERFEVPGLAHYSYGVGCQSAGVAAIIDPRRDVDVYLDWVSARGLRITHVLETHIHADFASGTPELAQRADAIAITSGHDEGQGFQTRFPHRGIKHGESINLGRLILRALHTPGHTPEHLCYLLYDGARSTTTPLLMFSGDFLFVGSVGRPDLLGEAETQTLASALYQSTLYRLCDLPLGLEIHPAHGAGSLCGAGMSGRPQSTLGYERIANPYLNPTLSESRFLDMILGSLPPLPPYYRRMKELNSAGAPPIGSEGPGRRPLDAARFARLARDGHVVVDVRDPGAFGAGHVPASISVGGGPSFIQWAPWVIPYDSPILLVADSEDAAADAALSLARVGIDRVAGHLQGGLDSWRAVALSIEQTAQVRVTDLHARRTKEPALRVLDVRSDAEWNAGHIENADHIYLGEIPARGDEVASDHRPIAVTCGGGYRSTIAASLLQRAGFANVTNVVGGMAAWHRAGLPIVTTTTATTPAAPAPAPTPSPAASSPQISTANRGVPSHSR